MVAKASKTSKTINATIVKAMYATTVVANVFLRECARLLAGQDGTSAISFSLTLIFWAVSEASLTEGNPNVIYKRFWKLERRIREII